MQGAISRTGKRYKRKMLVRASFVALAVAGVSGCVLDPNVPTPELLLGATYRKASPKDVRPASSPQDFAVFKSRRLVELISISRGFNLDVGAAIARIQQAEAQVRIAFQPLIPTIEGTANASESYRSLNLGGGDSGGGSRRSTQVNAQLNGSYEVDLWGRRRAAFYGAQANQYFNSFDAVTIAITTDASVATTYFNALATKKQIDIARQNLVIAERTLEAVRARNRAGTASGLDVAQQETLAANVRTTIPPLEQTFEQAKNALAVLVGQPPELFRYSGEDLFSIGVPTIAPGLPSDLLYRRPDIAAAEAQLAQARFNVSASRAAFFPTILLTGSGGFASTALKTLFEPQSLFYNAAAGLTQPITNAYEIQAQLDFDKARYAELTSNYRKAILSAFQDVGDSLIAYRKSAEQERFQRAAVTSARRAFEITEAQLRSGIIDLTTLLSVQQTLFNAETALVQVRQARLQAGVSLYRALGGGWTKPTDAKIAEVPSIVEVKSKAP